MVNIRQNIARTLKRQRRYCMKPVIYKNMIVFTRLHGSENKMTKQINMSRIHLAEIKFLRKIQVA
jgi:hypothetical protein